MELPEITLFVGRINSWKNVAVSAAMGGVAGFLVTTPLGLTWAGVAGIGAATGAAGYVLTTPSSERTAAGWGFAATSGALGGAIAGKFPVRYMFRKPSPFLHDSEAAAALMSKKAIAQGTAGSTVSGYDYTQGLPKSPSLCCGCSAN